MNCKSLERSYSSGEALEFQGVKGGVAAKLYALRGLKNTGLRVSALCFRANLRAAAALGFVVHR